MACWKNFSFARLLLTIGILLVFVFFPSSSRADICVVKRGNYPGDYSGVKVCAEADLADGTEDDTIEIEFHPGEDIEIDVVYQQEDVKYRMDLFCMRMYYDTANMTAPVTCNVDPSGFFHDSVGLQINEPTCYYDDDLGYPYDHNRSPMRKVIAQYEMQFYGESFPSANNIPDSFIMDQVKFNNESYTVGDTYEYFSFSTIGGSPADMGAIDSKGWRCPLFTLGLQCRDMGITTAQTLLKTRVVITEQPGPWTASPSARRAVCIGDDGCTDNSGTATLQFSYETPAGCYSDVACSTTPDTACGATSVVVRPEGGSEDDDSAPENDGVFTTTLNVGDTSPRYAVYGVSETGLVSTKLECSADTGVFYVEPVECVCGKPPEISLDDQEIKYGETGTGAWAVNRAISVNFKLEDEDITNPDTLPSSVQEIKMFFTTDGGATTHFVDAMTNTRSRLDSTGSFTAEIPAEYVTGESDIFFAVIATDEDGLEGVYPPGFYCYSDTSCDWTAKDTFMVIPTDAVVEDTNLHFTKEPFPNQLPFRAGPDSLLKIYFNMSGEADVTMRIYSMDGALIRQVGSDRNTQLTSSMERSDCTGEACNFCNYATGCAWDGTNMGGAENYVTNGMYVVNIHASGDGILAGQEYDYTKAVVVMK